MTSAVRVCDMGRYTAAPGVFDAKPLTVAELAELISRLPPDAGVYVGSIPVAKAGYCGHFGQTVLDLTLHGPSIVDTYEPGGRLVSSEPYVPGGITVP